VFSQPRIIRPYFPLEYERSVVSVFPDNMTVFLSEQLFPKDCAEWKKKCYNLHK